jgi:hypothetical protein
MTPQLIHRAKFTLKYLCERCLSDNTSIDEAAPTSRHIFAHHRILAPIAVLGVATKSAPYRESNRNFLDSRQSLYRMSYPDPFNRNISFVLLNVMKLKTLMGQPSGIRTENRLKLTGNLVLQQTIF